MGAAACAEGMMGSALQRTGHDNGHCEAEGLDRLAAAWREWLCARGGSVSSIVWREVSPIVPRGQLLCRE
jgi:hypothetical protein